MPKINFQVELEIEIGRYLREQRVAAGLTQKQLADLLELTPQQVQRYENGANRIPASTLLLASRKLDRPAGAFLGEVHENPDQSVPSPKAEKPLLILTRRRRRQLKLA